MDATHALLRVLPRSLQSVTWSTRSANRRESDVSRTVTMRTLSFSLLATLLAAQEPRKDKLELEPLQSALTYHTPSYYPELRRVLLHKAPADDLQLLILPSLEPEALLSVYRTKDGCEAQVVRPVRSILEHLGDQDAKQA